MVWLNTRYRWNKGGLYKIWDNKMKPNLIQGASKQKQPLEVFYKKVSSEKSPKGLQRF